MTKKHFDAFAAEIRLDMLNAEYCEESSSRAVFRVVAQSKFEMVCRVAYRFNSKFDKTNFIKACQPVGINS
jgi:hypothetical protein